VFCELDFYGYSCLARSGKKIPGPKRKLYSSVFVLMTDFIQPSYPNPNSTNASKP